MKDIAVIIPVYNGERLIAGCVKSLANAGERVAEVIIVDDGSTDGTLALARSIAERDGRIRVIHTENHGSYEARRTGIAASKARYIAFLDVDDSYCDGALDALAGLLESHGADVAMGGIVETTTLEAPEPEAGETTVREQTPDAMWRRIMRWGTQEFILYIWHKLYQRELLCGMIEAEGICQGDDVLITCQAFRRARRIVETTQPVYKYYQNPESLMHAGFGDRDLDLIPVWDRVVSLMRDQSKELRYMAQFNRWRTDFTLICRLILADDRELDRQYAGELGIWRESLKAHWKALVAPHAMPRNRELLVIGLRFAYGPMKAIMRLGKRTMNVLKG